MSAVFIRLLTTFLMIAVGWLARKRAIIDQNTTKQLSRLLTSFFYPSLIFVSITTNFTTQKLISNWPLPLGAFSIMLSGFLAGLIIERFIAKPKAGQEHAFLFQCTINNFTFLPIPLALMLWGEQGVAGVIFSALGSEFALWTLGMFALSGRKIDKQSLKRMLSPPLITILISLAWVILRDLLPATATPSTGIFHEIHDATLSALRMLGGGTIPVAMLVAGSRMASLKVQHLISRDKLIIALLRLILIPAAAISLLELLNINHEQERILILIATMPSAVASVVFSELFNEDAEFAAACVLLTHILSLITIPLWISLVL